MAVDFLRYYIFMKLKLWSSHHQRHERQLLSLPPGLGMKIFVEAATKEFNNSSRITQKHQNQILRTDEINQNIAVTTEYQIVKQRAARYKEKLDMFLESMSTEERKNTLAKGQKGVSNWH